MKPLILFHASCADGFGAAFAAWKVFADEAEYVPVQYGTSLASLPGVEGREVYVLDFSFPRGEMEALFAGAARVVWLDHHKTAFEMWGVGMPWFKNMDYGDDEQHHIELDNNRSGALLAWQYFHPNVEVPMLIRHIDDRDRWVWKMEQTKAFSEALNSYPYSFECWDVLLDETGYTTTSGLEGYDRFIEEGGGNPARHPAAYRQGGQRRSEACGTGRARRADIQHDGACS
jgi:uncharacterized protein